MLNCTDELCHLHHHHHHQHHDGEHIHHQQHELDPQHQVMSSGEIVDALDDYDSADYTNGTEPDELPSSSHVDAPSEGLYTACGVLIAMLLVALIILLLALTISKLRKREDTNGTVVQHNNANSGNVQQQNCANTQQACVIQQTELTVIAATQPVEPPPFLWVYSTSNHSLDTQVHHSQDLLVRPDSCDIIDGECNKNGIKKNLRGKWNKLVKKKPHHDVYNIPAELRPQLKQIYVY